jgi:hypothetical protein
MKCPECLIGDINLSHKDKIVFFTCSLGCFDTHISDDIRVAKILLHNYRLKEAKLEGRKASLFGENKNNPYTHETYARAWEEGFENERFVIRYEALNLCREKELEEKAVEVQHQRGEIFEKLEKTIEFLDELLRNKYWRASTYRKKIKEFKLNSPNIL